MDEKLTKLMRDGWSYRDFTIIGTDDGTGTYILVDEAGNKLVATYVDEETVFDATANDIREGKVAATEDGVTVGTKEIPMYHTNEGMKIIMPGSSFAITNFSDYEYTKLQVVFCAFNTSLTNSVATDKVCIEDNVYNVASTEILSAVTVNADDMSINFGIKNDGSVPYIMRYFTYKEEL